MHKRVSVLAVEHPFERTILSALFALLMVLMLAYLYFVGASVLNIIARKEASAESVRLQSGIASMEKEYFALSQEVTTSNASALGLAPVSDTAYVYRPGNAASAATIRPHGI